MKKITAGIALFMCISSYAQSNLTLGSVSGKISNNTQISNEGAILEISVSSYRPGGLYEGSFYGQSCEDKKIFKTKIAKDGSYQIPDIKIENQYSNEYCLRVKLLHESLDYQPYLFLSFSSESEYSDTVSEIFLERTFVDPEKFKVKVPYNLTFKKYVKEALKGTSIFNDEDYTWEFELSYQYFAEHTGPYRSAPIISSFNTVPCKWDRTCIATKNFRANTNASKDLYSTLSSKGNELYHLAPRSLGPLKDFTHLVYRIELNIWNNKTGYRETYANLNPKFNQSQLDIGYQNKSWGNSIPVKTLQVFQVELNSDLDHINKVLKSNWRRFNGL